MLKNIMLSIVSLIVSLGICEAILRFSGITRNVGPSLTQYDPLYGKRLKPNLKATRWTPEFTIDYSINSLGFRGPEPEEFPFNPILFLGDSFTEGFGVNQGQEFPELVRRRLQTMYGDQAPPIVNAGIGNTGNAHWIKFLEHEGQHFNPKLVVLQMFENDFYDNLIEGYFSLDEGIKLVENPIPPPGTKEYLKLIIAAIPGLSNLHLVGFADYITFRYQYRCCFANILTKNSYKYSKIGNFNNANNFNISEELTFKMIEKVFEITKQRKWKTVMLFFGLEDNHEKRLIGLLNKEEIAYVIIPSRKERPNLYYKVDGHWNQKGHVFAAERVMELIEKSITFSTVLK